MNTTQTETLAELIERLRSLSIDHGPKGWPAVRTRDVTALLDRIAELEAQLGGHGAGGVNGPPMTTTPTSGAAALPEALIYAGMQALLQCAASELENLSPMLFETYSDDVQRVFEAMTAQAINPGDTEAGPEGEWYCETHPDQLKVLAAVQRYLPPDGPSAHDTLTEIMWQRRHQNFENGQWIDCTKEDAVKFGPAGSYGGWEIRELPSNTMPTADEIAVIHRLLDLARQVDHALDDAEEVACDGFRSHNIDGQDFADVVEALDALEDLPDDKPGMTLGPAGKAEWALRRLLPNIRAGISHSSTDDSCQYGGACFVYDCLWCGALVCCGKCCADDSVNEIDVSGEIAYQLTKKLVIDMPTARAAVDAAIAALPAAQAEGWVSVEERLPEPNVEVLCAGRGWGNSFVTACYYDDERREWYPINTHWTDATGCAQYPTHWMPLPPSPSMDGESNG